MALEASPNTHSLGRIDGIQWLRGLAALAVVLNHAGAVMGAHPYAMATGPLKAGVDLFFVISGFVIAMPVFADRAPERGTYLFARLVRIYPMAILTTALYMAFVGNDYPDPPLPGFLASAFLVPSPYANIPAVIWTLKQEILFYVLFLAVLSDRKAGLAIVFVWCLASLAHELLVGGETSAFLGWLFHVKNVEFGFGIIACMAFSGRQAGRALALLLICAGCVTFLWAAYLIPDSQGVAKTLGLGGSAGVIVYAIASVRLPRSPALMFLGSASYSIYLINLLAIVIVSKVLGSLVIPGPPAFGLVAMSGVAAGILYHVAFERPLEGWRKTIQAIWFARERPRREASA